MTKVNPSHSVPLRPIYQNNRIQLEDGRLVGYTNNQRKTWYLKRGLAIEIDDKTIQLLTTPDDFEVSSVICQFRPNICVVCGTPNELTRHHIVPESYQYYIKRKFNLHHLVGTFDIVALCCECHNKYELCHANILERELSAKYNEPIGRKHSEEISIGVMAKTLLRLKENEESFKLSIVELTRKIQAYVGQNVLITNELLEKLKKDIPPHYPIGQRIVEKLDDPHELVMIWRNHFIETMSPKYMPPDWDININYLKVKTRSESKAKYE